MRRLLDFLAQYIEPYVSYRYLLAVVFTVIFVSDLLGTWLWLRDLGRSQAGASAREQSLRRIARKSASLLLLRLFSWDTVRRQGALILELTLLFGLAITLNVWIFGHT